MVKVIGVGGQARAGKDETADRLRALFEDQYEWRRAGFASAVKKIFCDTFEVDAAFIEKWKVVDECPPGFTMPVRKALQFIGDGYRKIMPDIWINLAFRHMEGRHTILSDLRYGNECRAVRQRAEGLTILLVRPEKINFDDNESEAYMRVPSLWCLENLPPDAKFVVVSEVKDAPESLRGFDVYIRNDGSLDQLQQIIETKLLPYAIQHFQGR